MRVRRAAVEIAIVVGLAAGLAAASLGLMVAQYDLRLGFADVFTAAVAGVVAAGSIRATILLHRRWKRSIGRITAAAALCALAAVIGAVVVMVPSECPGEVFSTGRCGVRDAAAWGQVAGLATLLNFMIIGIALALFRGVRAILRDGTVQGGVLIGALRRPARDKAAKSRGTNKASKAVRAGKPHGTRDTAVKPGVKGRPTRRRADAERARRDRLRAAR